MDGMGYWRLNAWDPTGYDLWVRISLVTAKVQIRGHRIRQAVTHGWKRNDASRPPGGSCVDPLCVPVA